MATIVAPNIDNYSPTNIQEALIKNHIFEFRPEPEVSEMGINELDHYLEQKYGVGFRPKNRLAVDPEKGRFATRVAKGLFEKTQKLGNPVRLDSDDMQWIGNLMNRQTTRAQYAYDFAGGPFIWKAGDFGDSGSCYWSSKSGARKMLEKNGGLALRFYHVRAPHEEAANAPYRGRGRCWLVPWENDTAVLYNFYGVNSQHDGVRTFVTHMNHFMGEERYTYKQIRLTNRRSETGLLWINGGSGFIVGRPEVIREIEHVDFGWDDNPQNYEEHNCSRCAGEFRRRDGVMHGGNFWCRACFEIDHFECEHCNEYHLRDTAHSITTRNGEVTWCDYCASHHAFTCDCCDQEYVMWFRSLTDDTTTYCRQCAVNYTRCYSCDQLAHRDNAVEIAQENFCARCSEDFSECDECHSLVDHVGGHEQHFADITLCESCMENELAREWEATIND